MYIGLSYSLMKDTEVV